MLSNVCFSLCRWADSGPKLGSRLTSSALAMKMAATAMATRCWIDGFVFLSLKTVCIICFVLWVSIVAVLLAWQKFLHCSIFWGAGTAGCLSLDTGWVPSVAAQLQRWAMEAVIVHEASGLIAREHASALQAPIGAFEFFERWMLNVFFRTKCVLHDRDS